MKEIIRLENVIKMADGNRRAVNGISLVIHEKERVAICGAPGSGKSTLMGLIAGMERPSDGKIFVLGKAVHEMDTDTASGFRNKNIGIMRRDPGFMDTLTVAENVALPLAIQGVPPSQRKQAAKEQLNTFGLASVAHACTGQLSAYELQLASLARALIAQPRILLIGDIAACLTAKETEQINGILYAVWKFGNYTVAGFSGAKNTAIRADRYLTLDHGKLEEDRS